MKLFKGDSFQRVVPEKKTKARLWMEKFWLGRAFFYFADIKFIRFLMVAGLNTLFSIVTFALLIMTGLHRNIAALINQIIGILFNFKTYGSIVFKNGSLKMLPRFLMVYTITYFVGIAGMKILVDNWLGAYYAARIANAVAAGKWADMTASAIMCLPVGFLGFFLNKKFVFERVGKDEATNAAKSRQTNLP